MLGMDVEVAVGRLQELGRRYQQDREGLHTELLSMMEGDQIATEYLMEFVAKIAFGDQSPASSDGGPEETAEGPGGQVLEFPRPKADEKGDDPEERE